MQVFVKSPTGLEARPVAGPMALLSDGRLVPADETPGVPMHDSCKGIAPGTGTAVARLVPTAAVGGRKQCLLFGGSAFVRLNGSRPLPVVVLRRGDEIAGAGWQVWFTDEAPLRVVAFEPPGFGAATKCTRCHRPLTPGEPVVYCPTCGVPYMAQNDVEPNCWSFGPCIVCKREPAPEFLWRPAAAPAAVPWYRRPWRLALHRSDPREHLSANAAAEIAPLALEGGPAP